MRATKIWHCMCGCNTEIRPGENFVIESGIILKDGHGQSREPEHEFEETQLELQLF